MRTFVVWIICLLAWDLIAKLVRLATQNTAYPRWAIVVDAIFAGGFAAWGLWVLAASAPAGGA